MVSRDCHGLAQPRRRTPRTGRLTTQRRWLNERAQRLYLSDAGPPEPVQLIKLGSRRDRATAAHIPGRDRQLSVRSQLRGPFAKS